MSSPFFQAAWVKLARYLVAIDSLATPADARAFLAPHAAAIAPLAPPQFAFGASPDPLVAWDDFTANLPAPVRPEIALELRSWLIRVRDSRAYDDTDPDAAAWYARATRAVALADDALPSVTDAASLALAQIVVLLQNALFLVVLRTFVPPPPQALFQPPPTYAYSENPLDPPPDPVYPDPVPLDRGEEYGVLPLGERWTLLAQRLQDLIDATPY